jgi:hypothetical protein
MTGLDERPSRLGSGRSTGRVLVYVSVTLAVAAAAVLVLGYDDARLLRLGILAALWAALAGAFAAATMRSQAGSAGDRTEDLRAIYQLELEREVAARREHELAVERDLRRDIEQSNRHELDALRAELRTLRENLESVLGGELLVERVALRAESTRVRSLADQGVPTASRQPALDVPPDRAGRHAPAAPPQGHGNGPGPPQGTSGLPRRDPAARADRRPRPETPPQPAHTGYDDDPLFGDVPWPSDPANGSGSGNGSGNGMAGTAPHGNGAHTGGRSVEELLAAYGGGATPRRRRRRADG